MKYFIFSFVLKEKMIASVPPTLGQKCHCGEMGDNRVARAQFGEFHA
jgi:hypothetical protein